MTLIIYNHIEIKLGFAYAVAYAFTMISLVVAIAFFTVLERKVLAAIQRRRGPNVIGL